MTRTALKIAVAMILFAAACSPSCVRGENGEGAGETSAGAGRQASSRSGAGGGGGVTLVEVTAEDAAALTAANAEFAFDLYGELSETEGNLFFSPHSISTALAMTYVGARGTTADEMRAVLRFPSFGVDEHGELPPEAEYRGHVAGSFGALASRLESESASGGHILAEANALWCQEGRPFLEPFLVLNREAFGAGVTRVDFAGDAKGATRTINDWVEEKTLGRIENLIREGDLDHMVRIVLTNAVYFKGRWAKQFDPADTRDAPFHTVPGDPSRDVRVPMMSTKADCGYARIEGDGVTLAELPYEGESASMLLLLPDEETGGLERLEDKLAAGRLDEWASALGEREVLVSLPRFEMTWGTEDIVPQLEALGMVDLFTDAADLSGMDGTPELYVSLVLHKAFVEVNEEGTEAAAATAVVGRLKASMPVRFTADRPFLFIIRDVTTGAVLFMGRVVDPTA